MIRTRDLVLFVVTILFMGIGIFVTVWTGQDYLGQQTAKFSMNDELPSLQGEVASGATINRDANIKHLREQIALDTSTITPQPDVFVTSEVADAPTEDEASAHADETFSVRECLYPDDVLPKISAWPATGVQLGVVGSVRTVSYQESVVGELVPELDAASTTQPVSTEVVTTTLLTLPVVPQKSPSTSCVPSTVIGVTEGGTMMLNTSASIWRTVSADTRIGYARDGYPIYGRYDGEVDACGGYQHATGYRYSITPDRPFIIGCFSAVPQSFNL